MQMQRNRTIDRIDIEVAVGVWYLHVGSSVVEMRVLEGVFSGPTSVHVCM